MTTSIAPRTSAPRTSVSAYWLFLQNPVTQPVPNQEDAPKLRPSERPDIHALALKVKLHKEAKQHKEATDKIRELIPELREEEGALLEARKADLETRTRSKLLGNWIDGLQSSLDPRTSGSINTFIFDGPNSPCLQSMRLAPERRNIPAGIEAGILDLALQRQRSKTIKGNDAIPYEHMTQHIAHGLIDTCQAYLLAHPEDFDFSEVRIKRISDIFDAILEHAPSVSEQTYAWLMAYALRATAPEGVALTPEDHNYMWTYSMGGDKDPPPYVELFLHEMLRKRSDLKGFELRFLPDINIIHVMHCQTEENTHAHDGTPLDKEAHLQGSVATLLRLNTFVERFYPEDVLHVHMHAFPAYVKNGSFHSTLDERLARSGLDTGALEALTGDIRGKVSSDEATSSDLGGGGSYGSASESPYARYRYAASHAYHSMLMSPHNTLRFASSTTETNLQVVAAAAAHAEGLPTTSGTLHAHVGWALPGPYYTQSYDPSFYEFLEAKGKLVLKPRILRDGTVIPIESDPKLSAIQTMHENMRKTLTQEGYRTYLEHIAVFYPRPLEALMEAADRFLTPESTTRSLLGLPEDFA